MTRLYLNSSAVNYGLEGVSPLHDQVLYHVAKAVEELDGILSTSDLSRLECRVKPLREGDFDLLTRYDRFFTRRGVQVSDISPGVIEHATELRARYNFKTPEAVHLATALEENAGLFLTGDAALARCREITVEVLRL